MSTGGLILPDVSPCTSVVIRVGPGHMFFRCSGIRVNFEILWIDSNWFKLNQINANQCQTSITITRSSRFTRSPPDPAPPCSAAFGIVYYVKWIGDSTIYVHTVRSAWWITEYWFNSIIGWVFLLVPTSWLQSKLWCLMVQSAYCFNICWIELWNH